jgi:hypothetical protein
MGVFRSCCYTAWRAVPQVCSPSLNARTSSLEACLASHLTTSSGGLTSYVLLRAPRDPAPGHKRNE